MPHQNLAILFSLLLLLTTNYSHAQDDFDLVAYQESMLNAMDEQGIEGVVVVVIDGDEVVYLAGLGSNAQGTPIDPAAAYDIGRLADPIVSTLALSEAERNLLAPEINVKNLLPSGAVPESYNGVTIARLMNHTAGLGTEEMAPLEALPFSTLPGIVLSSFPGERFSYCTRCYGLLVTTLETIGGQPIDAQLEQSVFYPLMMDDTRVEQEHIYSTALDMAKFMSVHIQDGRWQGVQLVKPETIHTLHRATISTGRDSREFAGYGWFVLTDAGVTTPDPALNIVITAYDMGDYRAQMSLIPGVGRGILLMTDQDTHGLDELTAITLEAFTGWTALTPLPTSNLSLLVGSFRLRDAGSSDWLAVAADNEALQISLGDETTRATFTDARAVAFVMHGHRASLFFPETGLAREAILTVDGITRVYQRVFE